jgi:hypothetical protein
LSRFSLVGGAIVWLSLAGGLPAHAQQNGPPGVPPSNPIGTPPGTRLGNIAGTPPDPMAARDARKLEELQMSDRFKHIQQDTKTLLQLANELQAAVDKTQGDQLSLDVIRKAEQIEKLAKSVKEKMRQQ